MTIIPFNQNSQHRAFADSSRELERLARKGVEESRETSVVASPGSKAIAFAAKIKGLSSFNVYNICMVEIGVAGSEPTEVGCDMQAVNLAEPFNANGQLAAGTFVAVSRVGQKNIFYAPV